MDTTQSRNKQLSLEKHVAALMTILAEVHGEDQLVLKAGKLDSLELMQSDKIEDRILALERLVHDDPTIVDQRTPEEVAQVLQELEDYLADLSQAHRGRAAGAESQCQAAGAAPGVPEGSPHAGAQGNGGT